MTTPAAPDGEARRALAAGLLCYSIWGFVPLYFQMMGRFGVGAGEILAQRTAWGILAALALVLIARQWTQVTDTLRDVRTLFWLTVSSLLIAANWLVFIQAVNSGRVLEGSLGYYINPLFNMVAGAVIFRERMNRIGVAAIACAAVGVALQALALGHFPVISLVLAITFAAYGVVRKRVNVDAQAGLLIECLILGIPGAMFIVWLQMQGVGHLTSGAWSVPMMIGSGVVTVAPLALFSWAARRMPLSTMGFLQFIGPTLGFAIGLFQGEAFTPLRAASFAFIWGAAVIFAYGAWRAGRRAAVVA